MIDVISISFIIACSAVFMANYNEPYLWLVKKLNLNRKPFNCVLCLSWWIGIIYSITSSPSNEYLMLFLAPMSGFLAVIIERLVASLPNSY